MVIDNQRGAARSPTSTSQQQQDRQSSVGISSKKPDEVASAAGTARSPTRKRRQQRSLTVVLTTPSSNPSTPHGEARGASVQIVAVSTVQTTKMSGDSHGSGVPARSFVAVGSTDGDHVIRQSSGSSNEEASATRKPSLRWSHSDSAGLPCQHWPTSAARGGRCCSKARSYRSAVAERFLTRRRRPLAARLQACSF